MIVNVRLESGEVHEVDTRGPASLDLLWLSHLIQEQVGIDLRTIELRKNGEVLPRETKIGALRGAVDLVVVPGRISLAVKTMSADTPYIPMVVRLDDTMASMADRAAAAMGVSSELVVLIFAGKRREGPMTVEEAGMTEGCHPALVIRPREG